MFRNFNNRIAVIISVFICFTALLPLPYLRANESNGNKNTTEKYSLVSVSLGDEFILHTNQSATLLNEDLEIKIVHFYNSPCPPTVRCFWSGVGMAFEYRHADEIKKGINLVQAFGYQTTIIASDHEKYAKLKVTKID